MMATSPVTDEDEVEFVSEGPLRPVLEYIDLLSDGENEDFPVHRTVEDQVDRQKAKVASTLDRLAHQVATEKQERAEKCRAFKEKIVSQQAHGRQELAFNASSGETRSAKHCVDMWLKMPGPKPGAVHTGWMKRRPAPSRRLPPASTHTCPVVNCGRTFDGVPLLEGSTTRPATPPSRCGGPSEIYACVACGKSFQTKEAWQNHYRSKHSSPSHGSGLSFQLIQCFACPCCCLLFNLRDQCLQHMAARNHISHAIILSEKTPQAPMPIPVPRYAQNQLIALCKEVPFCVRCSSCRRTLSSHMEARAHFSVQCRQGGAVAEAAQTVAEVLRGCARSGAARAAAGPSPARRTPRPTRARRSTASRPSGPCRRPCCTTATSTSRGRPPGRPNGRRRAATRRSPPPRGGDRGRGRGHRLGLRACGLSFPEEAAARHLLAANQIFHRCGVCGKEMGEAAIARLHMSRFHGGAHLSNFLFRCRRCGTDAPGRRTSWRTCGTPTRDTPSTASGRPRPPRPCPRTAYTRQAPSLAKATPAKPPSSPADAAATEPAGPSGGGRGGRGQGRGWLCRMCEDVFGSEAEPARPRLLPPGGGAEEEEEEEQEEEAGPGETGPSLAGAPGLPAELLCPCMGAEEGGADQKAAFTRCMRRLAGEGLCSYACPPAACAPPTTCWPRSTRAAGTAPGKRVRVLCGSCPESAADVPSFHSHFHARHCPLEPCASLRGPGRAHADAGDGLRVLKAEEVSLETKAEEFEEVKQETGRRAEGDSEECDEDLKRALALSAEEAQEQAEGEREMEEALQRSLLEF
ncbi:hypothetical protein ANANG_G00299680 [Anguilla anguilla]|uniref:C2H2-type domain-containing protein n=1 Tax=Anguilla anguilla TaxID=7936 RepID=A0A9D3RHS1_ANGAN|nr:hypothetical protein ANANG_G00299680 [Anguilla anguilla]